MDRAPIRLTVLIENTASGRGVRGEHGLSLWIERGPFRFLFDTGQTDLLCRNADRLGIDLGRAEAIVLSHGHYDHTGGLDAVLAGARDTPVFAHPAALEEKYAKNPDGTLRFIGMPARGKAALQTGAAFVPTEAPTEIGAGFWVTGFVPRETAFENTGGPFFRDPEGLHPDEIEDDQALVADTPAGLIVILGCAHAGVVNTLRYIRKWIPGRPVHAVFGGMHLGGASPERMDRTVDALKEIDAPRLYPLHCTGFAAAARLWKECPGRVRPGPVGTVLEWGGAPNEPCVEAAWKGKTKR